MDDEPYTRQDHDTMLQVALSVAPAQMTLRDADGWQDAVAANQDDYSRGVLTFACRWARLMEGQMAEGYLLESCARATGSLADNEGITGFMYGAAVSILAQVWVHGEQLRRWHNLSTQLGNEGEEANARGGVLNPALLNIGGA